MTSPRALSEVRTSTKHTAALQHVFHRLGNGLGWSDLSGQKDVEKTLAHLRQATTVGQAFASFQPSVASKWMAALGRILLSSEVAVRCRRPRDGAPTLTDSWGLQPTGRSARTGSSVVGAAFWVGIQWRSPEMVDEWQLRSKRGLCALSEANNAPTQQLIIRHYVFDDDTYSARPHPVHLQTVAHADETRSRTDRATALRLFVDLSPQAGSGSKLSIHAPNKWPLQAIASRLAVAVSVVYHSLFLLSTVWPLATRMILGSGIYVGLI